MLIKISTIYYIYTLDSFSVTAQKLQSSKKEERSFQSGKMVASNLKSETMDLIQKRTAIEVQMDAIISRLCQPGGPGLSGNLVDSEVIAMTFPPRFPWTNDIYCNSSEFLFSWLGFVFELRVKIFDSASFVILDYYSFLFRFCGVAYS